MKAKSRAFISLNKNAIMMDLMTYILLVLAVTGDGLSCQKNARSKFKVLIAKR